MEMPNPFYEATQPAQQAQLVEGIPEEFAVLAGLQPGSQEGGTINVAGAEIATAPVSIANLESWTREGFASLLSYYVLGAGAYSGRGNQFGEDTEYQGGGDLSFAQEIVKGYIESRKHIVHQLRIIVAHLDHHLVGGQVYSFHELREWLRSSGFADVSRTDLGTSGLSLVVGTAHTAV